MYLCSAYDLTIEKHAREQISTGRNERIKQGIQTQVYTLRNKTIVWTHILNMVVIDLSEFALDLHQFALICSHWPPTRRQIIVLTVNSAPNDSVGRQLGTK